MVEDKTITLEKHIMDWTAIFVRLWMHDINRFTRATGLSFGQMNLMLHIHYRGPCEVSGVSELMQMTPPGASQMVERMVQQGLVSRSEIPGDRRVRLVHLTDQGNLVVQECIHAHEKWVRDLAESLTPEQQDETARALKVLIKKANLVAAMK
jgi:DNA-binding MarR family transcriptional regulator